MIQFQKADASATEAAHIETNPVRRMADAMLEIDGGGFTVDREAIRARGFSAADIDKHGIEARDLANALSQRRAA